MDGQARFPARDHGRLNLQRGREGRAGLCRRNHPADPRSRLRIDEDGLFVGAMPGMTELFAAADHRRWVIAVEDSSFGECAVRHLSGSRYPAGGWLRRL